MRVTNITEAKAQLSRLVDDVQDGEPVIIGRAGRPLAVLSAFTTDPSPRKFGGWAGQVWMADDFDETPEDLIALFEGDEPTQNRDPFDRILVAQALVEGLTLVTRDRTVLQYDVPTLRA